MGFTNFYEWSNKHLSNGMCKAGRHLPKKVRESVDSHIGFYVSIATVLGCVMVTPLFYVGLGAIIAQNTCRVTNEFEQQKLEDFIK